MLKLFAAVAVGFAAGVAVALAFMSVAPHVAAPAMAPTAPDAPVERRDALLTADPLGGVDVVARVALMRWMAAHAQYEFIMRDFCGCTEFPDPACPEPGFVSARGLYPYSVARDYNGDGDLDFAVMLALRGEEVPDTFLIFNGPFGDGMPVPAYTSRGWQRNDHVSGGFVGPPESDNGYNIKAKGATYELVYAGDPQ